MFSLKRKRIIKALMALQPLGWALGENVTIRHTLGKWRNLEEPILIEKDLLSFDFSLHTYLQGKIHYEKHSHLNK